MMFRCDGCGGIHEVRLCDRHAGQALQFAIRGAPIRVWVVSHNGRAAGSPQRRQG